MPNIGSVLKQEIARLSRRELRGEMQATKKASTQYRHHIAMLRRQLSALERQVLTLQRRVADGHRAPPSASGEESGPKRRFAASRLRAQRTRQGLTAGEYAKLLDVSEQTVYNWEHGTHRPGQDRLAVIAELRGLGKRALQARLEDASGKREATKPPAAKKRGTKKRATKRSTKKSAGTKRSPRKLASTKRGTKAASAKKRAPKTSSANRRATKAASAKKQARKTSTSSRRRRAASANGNARPQNVVAEATPSTS